MYSEVFNNSPACSSFMQPEMEPESSKKFSSFSIFPKVS